MTNLRQSVVLLRSVRVLNHHLFWWPIGSSIETTDASRAMEKLGREHNISIRDLENGLFRFSVTESDVTEEEIADLRDWRMRRQARGAD